MFEAHARERLREKASKNHVRTLKLIQGIDFSSNDYLGFAHSPELLESFKREVQSLTQLGSTGSRLLSGHQDYHQETEERLARIFRAEAALIFSSGHLLNVGLIQCLGEDGSVLILDELCHNSFKTGARASKAETFYFRHNDLEHLRERLKRNAHKRCFILVESPYSMDGDLAPLGGIVALAQEFGAEVVVDEAHGTGVVGPKGLGLVEHLGLQDKVLARVITFGKALGAEGASVLGSNTLKEFLVNFCQTFIYTTGASMPMLKLVNVALDRFVRAEAEILKLQSNVRFFSELSGLSLQGPIVPWMTEERERTRTLGQHLCERGINASPIFSPTVQRGKERIRVVLHSFNSEREIRELLKVLKEGP